MESRATGQESTAAKYRQSEHPLSGLPTATKRLSKTNLQNLIHQHDSDSINIAHGVGHVVIPNPRYVNDHSTPRYAAFRLANYLNEDQKDELRRNADILDQVTICLPPTAILI